MKNLLFILSIIFIMASCGEEDPQPTPQNNPVAVQVIPSTPDTVTTQPPTVDHTNDVKFTLYSNRVPFIWKRVVNGIWVQDSIKTNNAVVYEPYDTRNMGIGYFVTMNLSGKPTDSLHIKAEYGLKVSEMSSVKGQSFAFVKLDDLR